MKIDRGIPLPERTVKESKTAIFSKLDIGDSVLVNGIRSMSQIGGVLSEAKRKIGAPGISFSSRPEGGGLRIWRVS